VVDTDHWRHFFLLLGLVWGLTIATINSRRRANYDSGAAMNMAAVPAAP
jgi:hypothetical protein